MRNYENPSPNMVGCHPLGGKLLILGAGQYDMMAAEIARSMGVFSDIAFLDDSYAKGAMAVSAESHESRKRVRDGFSQVSLIGSLADLPKFAGEFRYGFVAIGNPELRRDLIEKMRYSCIIPAILVHPSAYVSPSAQLQMGCCIEPLAVVQTGAVVATASFIASGAVVRHNAFVGDFCHVDCNAVIESTAFVPVATKVACNSVFRKEQNS